MLSVATLPSGKWKENCYVVFDAAKTAIVIDPGEDAAQIMDFLRESALNVAAIANTHAHYDHVGAVAEIKAAFGAKFFLHNADFKLLAQANFYRMLFEGQRAIQIPEVDQDLANAENLQFGAIRLQVIPTPGHTAGGVSFLIEDKLFTGDTIIGRKPGRTDLPGGNALQLAESVQKILALAPEILLYPGHGKPVSIGEIRQSMLAMERLP
jgi:glyoxylase-like metal-dependent hydrolase (beta-lactamase superfamily II)